ncbi:MAG: YhdH/YhfP family quinone oxidoreductase [Acidimicrobiales bacterium]
MRAFQIDETDGLGYEVVEVPTPLRGDGEVLVAVEWSGVNYKDAMVAEAGSRVRRTSRLIGGVDAAGVVVASDDPDLPDGTSVAVHGGALGVARDGGFAQYVTAPRAWISPLPAGLTTHDAMAMGTAGLAAMASVLALEDRGDLDGEVLVTGATGGVGSIAVSLLAARGHRPVASTGSPSAAEWLRTRGATRVIGRDDVADRPDRVLGTPQWVGAIDCVGSTTLAGILRSLSYGAAVAASGLVAGPELATTVYPFITRNVALLGIDVVEAPPAARERLWRELATTVARIDVAALVERTIGLADLPATLDDLRAGTVRGRILVDPAAH